MLTDGASTFDLVNPIPLPAACLFSWLDAEEIKQSLLVRWCISTSLEQAIAAKRIAKSQRCGNLLYCLPKHMLKLVAFLRGFKDRRSVLPYSRIQDSTASY